MNNAETEMEQVPSKGEAVDGLMDACTKQDGPRPLKSVNNAECSDVFVFDR